MKIVADKSRCAGHARCAAVAEQLFELDGNGYIAFDEKVVPAEAHEQARRGVRACPERALKLVED
jgi:ferredoxin